MSGRSTTSTIRVNFSHVLRAYQAGGVARDQLLTQIDELLEAGAVAAELLDVLRRREYVESLPPDVLQAVLSRLESHGVAVGVAVPVGAGAADEMRSLPDIAAPRTPRYDAPRLLIGVVHREPAAAVSATAGTTHRGSPSPGNTSRSMAFLVACVLAAALAGWWVFRYSVRARDYSATNRITAAAAPDVAPMPAIQPRKEATPGLIILDCPDCPEMIVLPRGHFDQGTSPNTPAYSTFASPQHGVTIDYLLALSVNDVTVGEFRRFVAATNRVMHGCDTYEQEWKFSVQASWTHPGFAQDDLHPVTCVSWNDAEAYVQWISAKSAYPYRLPSAAEWEYAARAGSTAYRPWDPNGEEACRSANVADRSAANRYPGWDAFACDDGYVNTSPVGAFAPNTFGLKDMLGNVLQWTEDCWQPDYAAAPADGSARTTAGCADHELRGGSWFSSPRYANATARKHFPADYRTSSVGFRLAREIK